MTRATGDDLIDPLEELPRDIAVDARIDKGLRGVALAEHLHEVDRRAPADDARACYDDGTLSRRRTREIVADITGGTTLDARDGVGEHTAHSRRRCRRGDSQSPHAHVHLPQEACHSAVTLRATIAQVPT